MSTPVTLERYAEMRAEIEAGRLRDEVLARAGLTREEWTVAQRAWLEKMGTELERGRFELTNCYTQAFLERQRAFTTAMPPAAVEAVAKALPSEAPLPSAPVAAPAPPTGEEMKLIQGISLAKYADICATLRAFPDQIVQIRSYYRMDEHAWTALHTVWQERFEEDPTLRVRWEALVQAALAKRAR